MVLKVRRQPKETSQGLIHRFSKKVRRSGILFKARKNRFRKRPQSRQAKKASALRRAELKRDYEKMRKLGKMEK
ncbi:hypothetical protein ACFL06_00910 [Patescibacteria group bacterium]